MKTAIVHDWLVTYAGAERALEQILALYPDADLYSLIDFIPDDQRTFLLNKKATTSFIQSLPFAGRKYRNYLPLMPLAIEQFDLSGYDLVISSSHAVAKGVLTHANQKHVCYCYTPIRYAWDLQHQYLKESGLDRGLKGMLAKAVLHYIRQWDRKTANRVDHYIAISRYIAERIKKAYGREATVIYPPVDIASFVPGRKKEDFYLTASRMVPYKKMDLIAEAFSRTPDRKLVVIGEGPDFRKVKAKAGGNVELLGYQPPAVMRDYLQRARAFVYAAEEDFGIVTVEAQACGTPVIAYGKGGVLETTIELKTGFFFREQTVDSLLDAVREFEQASSTLDVLAIRRNTERFGADRFKKEFRNFIDRIMTEQL